MAETTKSLVERIKDSGTTMNGRAENILTLATVLERAKMTPPEEAACTEILLVKVTTCQCRT
jgi:hypothetical protein